jgi:glycosyltransferase involved in cell wall biosynthesis
VSRPGRTVVVAASVDTPGGQGVQALALVEGLRSVGRAVELVPVDAPFPRPLALVRRVPYARTILNEFFFLRRLRAVRGADTVVVFAAAHWSFRLGPVPAIAAARRTGAYTVLAYHSGEAEEHFRNGGRALRRTLREVDRLVVPSEFLAAIFARHGHRAEVIPNVVDTSRFRFRERRPLRPRLVSTRNLDPIYDVGNTLRAFARVRATRPEAELVVVGDGSEARTLRELGASIGGVRFAGAARPEAMPGFYDAADVFVNSSTVDNQPVSVLEAFAAGLPVVSTAAGGLKWMVRHGETGMVVPEHDPDAMARAVAALLDDPDRAQRLARRARQEVDRHTWRSVREAWLDAPAPDRLPRSA